MPRPGIRMSDTVVARRGPFRSRRVSDLPGAEGPAPRHDGIAHADAGAGMGHCLSHLIASGSISAHH